MADPRVGFLTVFDLCIVNTHGLDWGFISMDHPAVVDGFMHAVVEKGQIVNSTFMTQLASVLVARSMPLHLKALNYSLFIICSNKLPIYYKIRNAIMEMVPKENIYDIFPQA